MRELKILTYPESADILLSSCKDIFAVTPAIRDLALNMIFTVRQLNALGLAANQVGELIRLCIIKNIEENQYEILINPVIITHDKKMINSIESCLSLPNNKNCKKKRFKTVTVQYLNVFGESRTKKFSKRTSIIIQHEIDHLNGRLLITK